MATVTCPQCGTANPAGSKFCDGCGINLTQQLHTTSKTLGGISGSAAPPPASASGPVRTTAPSPPPAQTYAPGTRLLPGQTLAEHMAIGDGGRYAIDRPLGKGGMGSIFLAHDTRVNNKPVVIKQMIPNFITEAERIAAEQGFQEEMRTLAAMAHPNIPNISDYFSEAGFDFIVQEYVPGEDLQKKLEAAGGKGLPEQQVLGWASQILAVLDYLTNLDPQVIHRDIKPANIVVDGNNRVRVVDFGVASHKIRTAAKPSAAAPASSGGQQISAPMGTPGYAPREQFLGQETPLSDIYALGATMHQLLTGRNPQPLADGPPSFSYPPVRQLASAVSEPTARIVAHALQNDAPKRYQAAAAMKADVDAILQPKGSLSTTKGKAVALALLLLALLAAGGGAAVYVNNQATLPATGAISTGKVAFDRDIIGRGPSANQPVGSATDPAAWAKAKADASVQWKDGNISRALALYQQASTNDQTDAESQIYVENAEIVQSGRPYWQVAVGVSLTGPALSSGRFALQGAYTAQHEINLGGGVAGRKLVLVLANDASSASGAAEAAKTAAKDSNLLGFIGYSSSSRTRAALPYTADVGIPHIAATASNPSLNGSSFFFRICPSDVVQGQQLARYALTSLLKGVQHPTIVVFRDPSDSYSSGLAGIFTQDVGASAGLLAVNYTVQSGGQPGTTLAQFQAIVKGFATKPDLIFFAGYAADALRLGKALDTLSDRATPVLSDDAFYDPAQFGSAAYGQVYKGRYHFTGYFYPDQRSLLPKDSAGARLIARMEGDYAQNFHAPGKPLGYGFARVPSEAALFYDAVRVLAQGIADAGSSGGVTRQAVRDALAGVRYQGVSGLIRFNGQPPDPTNPNPLGIGDPIDKALLVLHLDAAGHTHPEKILGRFE